jgi:hypothetical protein
MWFIVKDKEKFRVIKKFMWLSRNQFLKMKVDGSLIFFICWIFILFFLLKLDYSPP